MQGGEEKPPPQPLIQAPRWSSLKRRGCNSVPRGPTQAQADPTGEARRGEAAVAPEPDARSGMLNRSRLQSFAATRSRLGSRRSTTKSDRAGSELAFGAPRDTADHPGRSPPRASAPARPRGRIRRAWPALERGALGTAAAPHHPRSPTPYFSSRLVGTQRVMLRPGSPPRPPSPCSLRTAGKLGRRRRQRDGAGAAPAGRDGTGRPRAHTGPPGRPPQGHAPGQAGPGLSREPRLERIAGPPEWPRPSPTPRARRPSGAHASLALSFLSCFCFCFLFSLLFFFFIVLFLLLMFGPSSTQSLLLAFTHWVITTGFVLSTQS